MNYGLNAIVVAHILSEIRGKDRDFLCCSKRQLEGADRDTVK